jgi:hypothetical protein
VCRELKKHIVVIFQGVAELVGGMFPSRVQIIVQGLPVWRLAGKFAQLRQVAEDCGTGAARYNYCIGIWLPSDSGQESEE